MEEEKQFWEWTARLATFVQLWQMILSLVGGAIGIWLSRYVKTNLVDAAISFAIGAWIFYAIGDYFQSKYTRRAHAVESVVTHAININDALVRYEVDGPYAYHFGISKEKVPEFQRKAAILLNQINLLRSVYAQRYDLGDRTEEAYLHWARTILLPWISSDSDLKKIWLFLVKNRDLIEADFLNGSIKLSQ